MTGAVLALKAIGKGRDAIKERVLSWTDGEYKDELQGSLTYAFTGSGADGQLEGKGWNHRTITLQLPEWKLKDFYNYMPEVKRNTESEESYQGLSERQRRLVSYFLRQEKETLEKSFKEIAEGASISESTLRRDVNEDKLPYFIDAEVKHGQTTVWQFQIAEMSDSAKTAFYKACVGAARGSDSTTTSVKENSLNK